MRADPEPIDCAATQISECAVTGGANANRPNPTDLLEMKGRQTRMAHPQTVSPARLRPNRIGKPVIRFPNLRFVDDFMQGLHVSRRNILIQLRKKMVELSRSRIPRDLFLPFVESR